MVEVEGCGGGVSVSPCFGAFKFCPGSTLSGGCVLPGSTAKLDAGVWKLVSCAGGRCSAEAADPEQWLFVCRRLGQKMGASPDKV